jgi:hypothetical protein
MLIAVTGSGANLMIDLAAASLALSGVLTLPNAIAETGVVNAESPLVRYVVSIESGEVVAKCRSSLNRVAEKLIAALAVGEIKSGSSAVSGSGYYIGLSVCASNLCPTALSASSKSVPTVGIYIFNLNFLPGVVLANNTLNSAKSLNSAIAVCKNELAVLVDNSSNDANTVNTILTVSAVLTVCAILTVSAVLTVKAVDTVLTVCTVNAILTVSASACNKNATDHEAHH